MDIRERGEREKMIKRLGKGTKEMDGKEGEE